MDSSSYSPELVKRLKEEYGAALFTFSIFASLDFQSRFRVSLSVLMASVMCSAFVVCRLMSGGLRMWGQCRFVSNLEGTTMLEIAAMSAVFPVGLSSWNFLILH